MLIVLIEDSATDVAFFREALRLSGYAADAELRVFRTFDEARPHLQSADAAVVDLGLPDCQGRRTLEELAKLEPLPRIVFTGSDDPTIAHQIGEMGLGRLQKSGNMKAVVAGIAHEMGRSKRIRKHLSRLATVLERLEKLSQTEPTEQPGGESE